MAGGITVAFIGKACIAVLFMWFCSALIVNVFGLPFYFPSNIAPSNEIMLYRGETSRVASASLLALLVFRYLFELKALPIVIGCTLLWRFFRYRRDDFRHPR